MIQLILEKLVADRETALWFHGLYLMSTAGIFFASGAFICHQPGKPSWQTRATAFYTVALTLPLLASLASQFQVNPFDAWMDVTWYSVFTVYGFRVVQKDLVRRWSEPRWIRGEFREPCAFDFVDLEALGLRALSWLGSCFAVFKRARVSEDGYQRDDSGSLLGSLRSFFVTASAPAGSLPQE